MLYNQGKKDMKRTEVILDPVSIKNAQTLPAVGEFVKVMTGNSLEKWEGAEMLEGSTPLSMIKVSLKYGNKSPQLDIEFMGYSSDKSSTSYYSSKRSLSDLSGEEFKLLLEVCNTTSYPITRIGGALVKEALQSGQFNQV